MDHGPLFGLAVTQHGLVTRRQLLDEGLDHTWIQPRLADGLLVPVTRRVLRIGGCPTTELQSALASVLDAGGPATLARRSALAAWGIPGFELAPHHVVRTRAGRIRPTATSVHTSRRLKAHHITAVHGVPVTTMARTLVDVAGELPFARLERICDWAWARGLLGGASLHRSVEELAGRGRKGSRSLRRLVADRPLDHRPPESNLEHRVAQILRDAGESPLERQLDVGDDDRWIGRVDLVDRTWWILFEVQSELFHASVSARRDDAARLASLRAAGFTVVELREFDVWHRPDRIVAAVRAARADAALRHARAA